MARFYLFVLLTVFVAAGVMAVPAAQPYKYRLIWMWETMDGTLEHVPSKPSFFVMKELLHPELVPRYAKYAKLLQSMKINGLVVTVSYQDHRLRKHIPELRALSEFLNNYGIGMYLYVPYGAGKHSPEIGKYPGCPYKPEFAQYWNTMADELFAGIPLLKGYVIKGMGYEGVPGPLDCQCDVCKSKSDSDRILTAFKGIAGSLARHHGILFYRTWTTGALQDVEFKLFSGMAGKFPANLILDSKTGYGDFSLGEFPHPLFGKVHPKSKHMAEFQIYGEYRGSLFNPCQMVTRWHDWMKEHSGDIDGMLGIVEADRETFDHPLNMVNWYAFGEYASNPSAQAEDIFRKWAEQTYGKEAAPVVVDLVKRTDSATWKLMYFKGAWIQSHSYLGSRGYLDNHLRGPWSGLERNEKLMGWGRPLNVYDSARAARYAADSEMELFSKRVEITPKLLDELSARQADAVHDYEEMVRSWQGHVAIVPKDTFRQIEGLLEQSLADARIWQANTAVFILWLQGKDYTKQLDELECLAGLGGTYLTQRGVAGIVKDYREKSHEGKQ